MISQLGTHAIPPRGTWGPPFEKVKGLSAFRRMDTVKAVSRPRAEIIPENVLAFVQRIDSHCLLDKTVEYWQATDALVIQALDALHFLTYHFGIFWASAQLQKHKM